MFLYQILYGKPDGNILILIFDYFLTFIYFFGLYIVYILFSDINFVILLNVFSIYIHTVVETVVSNIAVTR